MIVLIKSFLILLILSNTVLANDYILETDELPDISIIPVLSNGHVGFTVYGNSIYMNGLYNGQHGNSKRARIPNYSNLLFPQCGLESNQNCKFRLDMLRGLFETEYENEQFKITQQIYPHRYFNRAIINKIRLERKLSAKNLITINVGIAEGDVTTDLFVERNSSITIEKREVQKLFFTTRVVEDIKYQAEPSKVFVAYTKPSELKLLEQDQFIEHTHVVTISGNENEVLEEMQAVLSSANNLTETQSAEWNKFWDKFDISVEGNVELNQVIHASIFYLVSNLPSLNTNLKKSRFFGLSPSGLGKGSLDNYGGHNFWDTEIWMFPSILLIEPAWSKELLSYRYMIRKAVMNNALENGYQGYKYPWEAAFTGTETTQYCCLEVAEYQHHITASIVHAVKQYMAATHDMDWFQKEGCFIGYNTAKFWASRVTLNKLTGRYDIKKIMGPDEDHWNITNNGYTNVIAAMNLNFGEFTGCVCKDILKLDDKDYRKFSKIAKNLTLIKDEKNNYYPQFEGYEIGTPIKQADTVLLGYPLQYNMPPEIKKNNLEIYENVTRANGPAMTWAMHTIGYLDIEDFKNAEKNFNRSYKDYIREPFKTWYEVVHGKFGAENFITGAGGFLQEIINGFGGIRLHFETLNITNFRLPPDTSKFTIKGVTYLNNKFSLTIDKSDKAKITFLYLDPENPIELLIGDEVLQPDLSKSHTFGAKDTIAMRAKNNKFGSCKLPKTVLASASTARLNFILIFLSFMIIFLKNYIVL